MSDKALREAIRRSVAHAEPKKDLIDRIEELEAKLAKAVESLRVIEDASRLYARDRESAIENVRYAHECTRRLCVTTLAELKGQNDE
jgi:hypothetical protein